jgi:hypothetical protein
VLLLAGCASAPLPASSVAFGLLGDTPYNEAEIERLEHVIDAINAADLRFVVPRRRHRLGAQCLHRRVAGGEEGAVRAHPPSVRPPAGRQRMVGLQGSARPAGGVAQGFPALPTSRSKCRPGTTASTMRWEMEGFVFVTLNVQGSNNNVRHPEEHGPRMAAVHAWLDAAAGLAEQKKGLVVLMQANPFIVLPRDGYGELRLTPRLARARRMPGRVILVHGDTHVFHDDEPIPGVRPASRCGARRSTALAEGAIDDGRLSVRQGP